MTDDLVTPLLRLYPGVPEPVDLRGLYLEHAAAHDTSGARPYIYTNYVVSFDGRIALEHPDTGQRGVPRAISNPRDWRLFQELAAPADALLVSGRYVRELVQDRAQPLPVSEDDSFFDLRRWRQQRGCSEPAPVVVVTETLDLPFEEFVAHAKRRLFLVTGRTAAPDRVRAAESAGIRVLRPSQTARVDGAALADALSELGFRLVYSIAGPQVLATLVHARVLHRLYLTQVHRMVGGVRYDSLFEGRIVDPPLDFELRALYYDNGAGLEQIFGVYDARR